MSGSQKVIKIVSVITIILAILAILLGLASCGLGGLAVGGAATDPNSVSDEVYGGMALLLGAGAFLVVGGIIDIIVGVLGLRGAKDPNKIMPFYVFAIIGLVFAILNLAMMLFGGAFDATSMTSTVVQLVLMIILVACAHNVSKMRSRY